MEKLFLGTKACASSPVELKKRSIGLTIGIGNNLKLDGDEVVLHCALIMKLSAFIMKAEERVSSACCSAVG
jgi:hypothetical protein